METDWKSRDLLTGQTVIILKIPLGKEWDLCNTIALQHLHNQPSNYVPGLSEHLNLRKCLKKP